jgi:hypothetical protein
VNRVDLVFSAKYSMVGAASRPAAG